MRYNNNTSNEKEPNKLANTEWKVGADIPLKEIIVRQGPRLDLEPEVVRKNQQTHRMLTKSILPHHFTIMLH